MRKFCVITNSEKDPGLMVTGQIRDYLKDKGFVCDVFQGERKPGGLFHYTDPREVPPDTDCVIVVGGDGTLLQAARDLVQLDLPLLGINLGELGYLAEVDRQSVFSAVDRLINDRYEIEERMMLQGTVFRGDQIIGQDTALNDIVLYRAGNLRIVNFKNYVNGEYLNSYGADAVIAATPTGSTGYSLSAGGPVVSPGASLIILTPVAPHTLNARSIILPAEDVITLELGPGRRGRKEEGIVSFDGDNNIKLVTEDRIVIRRAAARTRIVKLNKLSFVEILRRKMQNS